MKQQDDKNFVFSEKVSTFITEEVPSASNPYVTETQRIYGYDLEQLLRNKSFVDVIFLLLCGELPSSEDSHLLDKLAVALCNPGPRHPATRSAMIAGVSKTRAGHILPLALLGLSGSSDGSIEVESAMGYISQNAGEAAECVGIKLCDAYVKCVGDSNIAPGFSSTFGAPDPLVLSLANNLNNLSSNRYFLSWSLGLSDALTPINMGINRVGMAAAIFLDLNIPPREAGCLYQLLMAPGLLAHGLEQTHKPITSLPFLTDEYYDYENQSK